MTEAELRERMIEIAECQFDRGQESPYPDDPVTVCIVDALLAAGAAEQWVMPWMAESTFDLYTPARVPLYYMKDPA